MTVTTFSMNSNSAAPTTAGAVLIPFGRRWSSEWIDVDDTRTMLRVEHPEEDTEVLVGRVLAVAPEVLIVT
jgi:hypothetical protein